MPDWRVLHGWISTWQNSKGDYDRMGELKLDGNEALGSQSCVIAGIGTHVWRLRPVMASMGIVWNRERIRLRSSMRISITEIPVYRWFKEWQKPCNAVQMHDNSGQMVGSGSLDNWAPKKNLFRVWSRGTRKKRVCAKNSRKKKKRR